MKLHIITLAFDPVPECFDTERLEHFCAQHQILSYEIRFFQLGEKVYWSICLGYESDPAHIPDSEKPEIPLTESQSSCLAALKKWRNEHAAKIGFPPFLIASNAMLENIAISSPHKMSDLLAIHGFGKKKCSKYGQFILEIVKKHQSHG